MKIGIDISQIVYKGGVVTYTQNLVQSLLDIDKKNVYVLFGLSWGNYQELLHYLNGIRNENVVKKNFRFPLKFAQWLGNRHYMPPIDYITGSLDVFHSSDWIQLPSRSKKITTIHDLAVYKIPNETPKEIIDVHKQRLEWVKKECDVVITDSYSTKKDIIYYLNIPENKIKVVYLGVDKRFVPQSDERIREIKKKHKITGDYILVFGAPGLRKNIAGVMKAFHALRNEIPHTLVIIGKSDEIGIQNEERILSINRVSFSDLPAIYSGASCFVYPSLYEGFGLPILEAMACECIVVSSDRGSLKEIMIPDNFLVDPDDVYDIAKKIKTALDLSKNSRRERIKKGTAHARKFTWEKCAQETLKIYEKVGSI